MRPQPESVPINSLVAVEGTPLEEQKQVSIWEMIRMIATIELYCQNLLFVYQRAEHK